MLLKIVGAWHGNADWYPELQEDCIPTNARLVWTGIVKNRVHELLGGSVLDDAFIICCVTMITG